MTDVKNLIENATKTRYWDAASNLKPYGLNVTRNFTCVNPVIVNSGIPQGIYYDPTLFLEDIIRGNIVRPGILPPPSSIPRNLSSIIVSILECFPVINFTVPCGEGTWSVGGWHNSIYSEDGNTYTSIGHALIFVGVNVNTMQAGKPHSAGSISLIHELVEWATDPFYGGMASSSGLEIADSPCNYPPALTCTVGGSSFFINKIYDNYINSCSTVSC